MGVPVGPINCVCAKWLSTSADVDHLQHIVSKSSVNGDWKVQHSATILRLLGAPVPLDFYGHSVDTGVPVKTVPEPESKLGVTKEQVAAALKACDLAIARLEEQHRELKAETKPDAS